MRVAFVSLLVVVAALLGACGGGQEILLQRSGAIRRIPNQVPTGVDTDLPCAGEPPTGCATPVPTPRLWARASAHPLRVPALDVPLSHLGRYEIEAGVAVLPDGYLSQLSLSLANGTDGSYDADIRVELRATPTASPEPMNRYERGVMPGRHVVHVFVVFDLFAVRPGAVMQIRDLVVG